MFISEKLILVPQLEMPLSLFQLTLTTPKDKQRKMLEPLLDLT
jgi:hypothetical protein